jgi:hypothetical protein
MYSEFHDYWLHGFVVRSAVPFVSLSTSGARTKLGPPNVVIAAPIVWPDEPPVGTPLLRTPWCEIDRIRWASETPDESAGESAVDTYVMRYPLHDFSFQIELRHGVIHVEPHVHHDRWQQLLPVMACGAVTTFACRLLGRLALHANTVEVNGFTVSLAGDSGSGKTLTSSLLILAGAQLITDDVTAIGEDLVVSPGLLEVRLRADDMLGQLVADQLAMLHGVSTSVTADERRSFQVPTRHESSPLTRVVLPHLDTDADDFTLEHLSPNEAMMPLLKSTRLTGWIDQGFQRSDFLFVASLADQLPIQRLRMPMVDPTADGVRLAAAQLSDLLTTT